MISDVLTSLARLGGHAATKDVKSFEFHATRTDMLGRDIAVRAQHGEVLT
jgi:hypothetical protein